MAVTAWTSLGAVLTCMLLPAPAGVLGTLLIGAVALVGLRASPPAARATGVLAAALLACAGVALAVVRADPSAALDGPGAALLSPALRDPGTWLPVLASAALVLGTAPLAGWTAAGLALAVPGATAAPETVEEAPVSVAPPSPPRTVGLSQVEAELARAAEEVRDLSLALLGIDPPREIRTPGHPQRSEEGGGPRFPGDPGDGAGAGDEAWAMALLDEAVAGSLTGSDSVCDYGPAERLVVLEGVSASALRSGAAQLCVAGADLSGRPVRAAVATFPADGATLGELRERLERDLESCRADGTIVAEPAEPVAVRT
jgi:hypothetical protein